MDTFFEAFLKKFEEYQYAGTVITYEHKWMGIASSESLARVENAKAELESAFVAAVRQAIV